VRGGERIILYKNPDALSVKSTWITDVPRLEPKVMEDLDALTQPHVHQQAGKRIEGLGKRRLHLLFEEGSHSRIGPKTRQLLDDVTKTARARGVEFQWFVYAHGKKVDGPTFFRQMALPELD
jgi:hypothetical protein